MPRSKVLWLNIRTSLCIFATLTVASTASAQSQPAAAEEYVRAPRMSSFNVSPSNRHAAFLMRDDNGRQVAAVIELEKPATVRIIAEYAGANVTRVSWINDKRLVYEAYDPGARIRRAGAGTFAVDLDGEQRRQLINWYEEIDVPRGIGRPRMLNYGWKVWRPWDGQGSEVLAFRDPSPELGSHGSRQLVRLNTVTGATTDLSFDLPPYARDWTFDGQGELRLISTRLQGRARLYQRESGQREWTEIENQADLSDQPLQPLYIERDGTVIVLSRRGRDTTALFTYDPRTRKLGAEPLAATREFDIDGAIEIDGQARQVVGVHLVTDRERSVWFDEGLEAAQRAVDAALPSGRSNRLLCGNCLSARRLVVRSGSDRVSAEYFVYDREARSLTRLGVQRPWLPEASQGRRSFHRVAARDGLSLPLVLTHPPGRDTERKLPAIVLVHGGPWERGTDLAWALEPQFLASRGYRVLEVDFRGSAGLGWKHFRSGWKQWGQAMQDDLADAVAWAVDEGLVDGARVCIVGSSYGGYAALMGLVRHPGIYRCAASHAGVTDLTLLLSDSDLSEPYRRFGYPLLVGDPKLDAEMLRRQSPLHRVSEIKAPVLLTQGKLDQRVTVAHADTFESAAKAAGVEIERVTYHDDAHGWFEVANHADYLRRLETFLARALKPAR